MLPAGLILLRAVVMVDAEDDGPGCHRRRGPHGPGYARSEVEGRPAAVRADLDDGVEAGARRTLGCGGECEPLVVGHESLGGTSRRKQALISRR